MTKVHPYILPKHTHTNRHTDKPITLMFLLMHRKVLKKNGEKEMQHDMYSYTTGCTNNFCHLQN